MTEFKKQVMTFDVMPDGRPKRQIRSFVLRQGRLTKGQQETLNNTWHLFGIDYNQDAPLNFKALFGNNNPVTLEIGFGMGGSLVEMAKNNPQQNYIGIEVHKPGVGACLMGVEKHNLQNIRVICHDALEVIINMIQDASLSAVQVFFPDPWHKAKHNKRRIINPDFIALITQKLKTNGLIHLATDWQEYAVQMLDVLSHANHLKNLSNNGAYIERPASRPITKFEKRGLELGHGVWDLQFIKMS